MAIAIVGLELGGFFRHGGCLYDHDVVGVRFNKSRWKDQLKLNWKDFCEIKERAFT